MYEPERHVTPAFRAWDAAEVRAAISEIAADTLGDVRAVMGVGPVRVGETARPAGAAP